MSRCKDHGLVINLKKCVFAVGIVNFLGYELSPQGSRPLLERVQGVIDFERPRSLHALRHFIGMVNSYRRCIREVAVVLCPLLTLLRGAKKKDMRPVP